MTNNVTQTTVELRYVIQSRLWNHDNSDNSLNPWEDTEPAYDDIEVARENLERCKHSYTTYDYRLALQVIETKTIPL
jgi:hypothetical protein